MHLTEESTSTGGVQGRTPSDTNSLSEPERVAPVERQVRGFSSAFTYDFPAQSVTFVRLTER
ncbi:alpha-L-arabinofuranosidase C-terminal domain-containing protein [Nonomuraea jabiensis]|uniref:Alpha-L-arabinofuranosidase n=1 Tax=Nonomuraea jabiensis TaxID=882448 RepID=A0A7W9GK43_9ACTN|nr:alpha-L-arabinofuranosidase C-terminal domain-containing protein [Nonomuraea jabiensis]MBB5785342.1 alpha-L-arabinofuranosidase [Nonomuraea jabiensis]